MSALTVDDFRHARVITNGRKHRGLSEDDALSLALDRLLIFNDGDLTVPCDEEVQLSVIGGELPQSHRVLSGRNNFPKLTSKLRRIRLGGFEYLRSIVHANGHKTSPIGSGSTAVTVDASMDTVAGTPGGAIRESDGSNAKEHPSGF